MTDASKTSDPGKPVGAEAKEAAELIDRFLQAEATPYGLDMIGEHIQRAIDAAVAPVEAERARLSNVSIDLTKIINQYEAQRDEARAQSGEAMASLQEARTAAGELWVAANRGLRRMREMRDAYDGDLSLGLVALADDIDFADCATDAHAAYAPEGERS